MPIKRREVEERSEAWRGSTETAWVSTASRSGWVNLLLGDVHYEPAFRVRGACRRLPEPCHPGKEGSAVLRGVCSSVQKGGAPLLIAALLEWPARRVVRSADSPHPSAVTEGEARRRPRVPRRTAPCSRLLACVVLLLTSFLVLVRSLYSMTMRAARSQRLNGDAALLPRKLDLSFCEFRECALLATLRQSVSDRTTNAQAGVRATAGS